jgi:hypothetical protein
MFLTGYLLGSPTLDARLILSLFNERQDANILVCVGYKLECAPITAPSRNLFVVPDSEDVLNATRNCTIDAPCDFATAEQLIEVCTLLFSPSVLLVFLSLSPVSSPPPDDTETYRTNPTLQFS